MWGGSNAAGFLRWGILKAGFFKTRVWQSMDREAASDFLRWCPLHGCLLQRKDKFCPWHGERLETFIGKQVGGYVITEAISNGGYGVVYKATSVEDAEFVVALKVLKPPYCYHPASVSEFIREATNTKDIHSVNIAQIKAIHRRPWPHIAMELIKGLTLQEFISERKESQAGVEAGRIRALLRHPLSRGSRQLRPTLIPVTECIDYLVGIARPLAQAHTLPTVGLHRDLKPLNIMLSSDCPDGVRTNRVRVIDWGIALKLASSQVGDLSSTQTLVEEEKKQRQIVGTLPYMAYEALGGEYSPRSDVYAFGVTAFQLLTGERPYANPSQDTVDAWKKTHDKTRPKRLDEVCAGIPRGLRQIVHRCLATSPEDRYRDCAEVLRVLEAHRAQYAADRRRRLVTTAASVVLIAVLALLVWTKTYQARLLKGPPWNPLITTKVGSDIYLNTTLSPFAIFSGSLKGTPDDLGYTNRQFKEAVCTLRDLRDPMFKRQSFSLLDTLDSSALDWKDVAERITKWVSEKAADDTPAPTLIVAVEVTFAGLFPPRWIDGEFRVHLDKEDPAATNLAVVFANDHRVNVVLKNRDPSLFLLQNSHLVYSAKDDNGFDPEILPKAEKPPRADAEPVTSSLNKPPEPPQVLPVIDRKVSLPKDVSWHPYPLTITDFVGNPVRIATLWPHPKEFIKPTSEPKLIEAREVIFSFETTAGYTPMTEGRPLPEGLCFRADLQGVPAKANSNPTSKTSFDVVVPLTGTRDPVVNLYIDYSDTNLFTGNDPPAPVPLAKYPLPLEPTFQLKAGTTTVGTLGAHQEHCVAFYIKEGDDIVLTGSWPANANLRGLRFSLGLSDPKPAEEINASWCVTFTSNELVSAKTPFQGPACDDFPAAHFAPLHLEVTDRSNEQKRYPYGLLFAFLDPSAPHFCSNPDLRQNVPVESERTCRGSIGSPLGLQSLKITEDGVTTRDSVFPLTAPEGIPMTQFFVEYVLERHSTRWAARGGLPVVITVKDNAGVSMVWTFPVNNPNARPPTATAEPIFHRGLFWTLLCGDKQGSHYYYVTTREVSWQFLQSPQCWLTEGKTKDFLEGRFRSMGDSEKLAAAQGITMGQAFEIAKANGWRLISLTQYRDLLGAIEANLKGRPKEEIYDAIIAYENLYNSGGESSLSIAETAIGCPTKDYDSYIKSFCGMEQLLGNFTELVVGDYDSDKKALKDLQPNGKQVFICGYQYNQSLLSPDEAAKAKSGMKQTEFSLWNGPGGELDLKHIEPVREDLKTVGFRFLIQAGSGEDTVFDAILVALDKAHNAAK